MTKLKATLESLDEIAEGLRELYVETESDGETVYVLDLDPETIRDHPEIRALKNALDRQKARASELQEKVSSLQEKANDLPEDFSSEEWEQLKELKQRVESGDHDKRRQAEREHLEQAYEAKLRRAQEESQKVIDGLQKEVNDLRSSNHGLVRDQALDRALEKVSIAPRHRKLVRAFMETRVKVVERDDGTLETVVPTEFDDETPLEKYLSTWADTDEGRVYVEQPTGSDSRGSKNGRGKAKVNPFVKGESWSLTSQARLVRENVEEARRLAREAGIEPNF